MKKLVLLSVLSLMSLTACNFNVNIDTDGDGDQKDQIDTNTEVPTNIRVELTMGKTTNESGYIEIVDDDVCINIKKPQNYNLLFFAHWDTDSYDFYKNDAMNSTEWEVIVPVGTYASPDREAAIKALTGYSGSVFSDMFNMVVLEGATKGGSETINGKETTIYTTGYYKYWLLNDFKMFMKCEPNPENEELDPDWCHEVTSYETINAFTRKPSF